jgi:hypothetical protein
MRPSLWSLIMKFKIEQIAICPKSPEQAKKLLDEMGAGEWAEDHVVAEGEVFGSPSRNEADLSFNYDLVDGNEFEVLHYTTGKNWIGDREAKDDWPREVNSVSHLGMHCTAEELVEWRKFFDDRITHQSCHCWQANIQLCNFRHKRYIRC